MLIMFNEESYIYKIKPYIFDYDTDLNHTLYLMKNCFLSFIYSS